jgi:hypothetical protein
MNCDFRKVSQFEFVIVLVNVRLLLQFLTLGPCQNFYQKLERFSLFLLPNFGKMAVLIDVRLLLIFLTLIYHQKNLPQKVELFYPFIRFTH